MTLVKRDFYLSRSNMMAFLAGLPPQAVDAITLYLSPGLTPDEVGSYLHAAIGDDIPVGLAETASSSGAGSCLFWGPVKRLVLPPFPIKDSAIFPGYITGSLASLLEQDRSIALVLVRLGAYALGVCRGETLITSKVGTGLIHGRHKKGGSSQQRFQRHREKQIEQFLVKVCERVQEHLVPYLDSLDHVVYGGAWTTIELLQKRCPSLRRLEYSTLPPLLDIPSPKQAVLEAAIHRIWASHIVEWQEEDLR